jgi:predicted ATP-binding protein involved in virulence
MSTYKLKTLEVSNFRKFKSYQIEFADNTTVLFGKNGVGKTSLLHALHKACSFIFSSSSKLGEKFLSAGVPGLGIQSFEYSDYYFDPHTRETSEFASITSTATFEDESLHWELYKRATANASLFTSKYEQAFADFYRISKDAGFLPVLAYKDSKMTSTISQQISRDVMPRNFGYFQWDFEAACTAIWETRLCSIINQVFALDAQNDSTSDRINERKAQLTAERDFIQNVLKSFSERLPGDSFKVKALYPENENGDWQLCLIFSDGTRSTLQKLPAGYRRLYSIVLDLAYRSFTLNNNIESPGLVIIDEIDLHLHPELEQSVVNCLQQVFPSFQFIISTHSPLVLTNIDTMTGSNIVYSMNPEASKPTIMPNIYGIDYSATVTDVMGVETLSSELAILADSYIYLRDNSLLAQAENVYQLMLQKAGNSNVIDEIIKRQSGEIH